MGKGERKDFFHYLLDAKDPQTGEGYSMSELWSESNLLIAAGMFFPLSRRGAPIRMLAVFIFALSVLGECGFLFVSAKGVGELPPYAQR